MTERENNSQDSTLGKLLIAAFLIIVMLADVFGWAINKIPLSEALAILFSTLILYFSLEYLVQLYRKFDGFFRFDRLTEEILLPLLESGIVVGAGWMILALFTIVLPTLAALLIWLVVSVIVVTRKFLGRYG